ncbi:MAG: phytanoyl-CoA dioxygenase [Acidimicrobiales bacterium]|nr:phytanoyl-CoA dioxygenase [Acidimicrobiales bacterium]
MIPDIDEFRSIVEDGEPTRTYSASDLTESGTAQANMDEISDCLMEGPGVIVIKGAVAPDVVDAATEVFWQLIDEQRQMGVGAGDHFAKAGANDRVWNALEKMAVHSPEVFVDYYANPSIALACRAWLGPGYQITSQLNVVNPGGEAQAPHRDYHLGFMDLDQAARFPRQAHLLSPVLTLQGAIAHVDMPVETGPTMFLPHSHKYEAGYLAWPLPEFKQYFADHHVQLPLDKGDAVFFNPALFHGAGTNRTAEVKRMANLLQIGSPMGRTLETVDRERVVKAVYPALLERSDHPHIGAAIAAAAEGYPFPTNLDRDEPIDAIVPESQAEMVVRAVADRWSPEQLAKALAEMAHKKRSH